VAPEAGGEARAGALGALGDVDVDQPGEDVHREHVAGVVGVDRLLEAPEQLLRAAVLADDGLPQAQRAVLDHRGEQELAAAGEQHLEALLLDDEVVLGDAELADDLGELRAGGAQLAEALEASDGVVEAGVAEDLGEDVLDLVPRAGDREGGEDAAADAVDADHLGQGGAEVAGLAEHEVGDDQVVAVVGHRRDVVEVTGLEVDAVLPLGRMRVRASSMRMSSGSRRGRGPTRRGGGAAPRWSGRRRSGCRGPMTSALGRLPGRLRMISRANRSCQIGAISRSMTRATRRSRRLVAAPPRLSWLLKGTTYALSGWAAAAGAAEDGVNLGP
jgi:hypothetical protein